MPKSAVTFAEIRSYVELRQQFTPQRLPGRGRLDAGCGLSS